MLVGLATYPGVNQFVNASFGFTHGISPSVCSLAIAPQPDYFPIDGTLEFTFGDIKVEFPDCRVDTGRITRNAAGEVWSLLIMDRRWKWRFGIINGLYNIRNPNGTIRGHELPPEESTERTPQQLAELCLKRMGESGFDVGELPNEQRPEVIWNDVPAEALARLCDDLGCRVVLRLDNTVKLAKVGVGGDLPTDGILSGGASVNPPDGPNRISIECGANRYQVDLALEAVGISNDTFDDGEPKGTIVPINSLPYKPPDGLIAKGWFINTKQGTLADNVVDDDDYRLAVKSVCKMYRVKFPLTIPGFEDVKDLDHVIIENKQVLTRRQDNIVTSLDAIVLGVFDPGTESFVNTDANTEYPYNWLLDTKTGIITFADVVIKVAGAGLRSSLGPSFGEADLFLRCAIQVRTLKTRELLRHYRTRQRDVPTITAPRVYKHHELHVGYTETVSLNLNRIDATADDFLDAAELEYQTQYPQSIRYMGLLDVDVDGAIQQISFDVSAGGTTTTLSRNTEELLRVPSYKEMRRIERQRDEGAYRQRWTKLAQKDGIL